MSGFFRVAWHVMRKDLLVEVRSLEILSTTLFFAVTVVLMFSFGWSSTAARSPTWRCHPVGRDCIFRNAGLGARSNASVTTTRCGR
jgi:hypothetical protein